MIYIIVMSALEVLILCVQLFILYYVYVKWLMPFLQLWHLYINQQRMMYIINLMIYNVTYVQLAKYTNSCAMICHMKSFIIVRVLLFIPSCTYLERLHSYVFDFFDNNNIYHPNEEIVHASDVEINELLKEKFTYLFNQQVVCKLNKEKFKQFLISSITHTNDVSCPICDTTSDCIFLPCYQYDSFGYIIDTQLKHSICTECAVNLICKIRKPNYSSHLISETIEIYQIKCPFCRKYMNIELNSIINARLFDVIKMFKHRVHITHLIDFSHPTKIITIDQKLVDQLLSKNS